MKLTIDDIKDLEKKMFPECDTLGDTLYYRNTVRGEYPWILFPPHFYAENPAILTDDLVEKLRDGGQLLSVGSGPAHLEQFLVKAYNISMKNITLSDVSSFNTPDDFKFSRFNMFNKWPRFDVQFDYIIFPESLFFGANSFDEKIYNDDKRVTVFRHVLIESLARLKPQGEIRMKGMLPPQTMVDMIVDKIRVYAPKDLTYRYENGESVLKRYLSIIKNP